MIALWLLFCMPVLAFASPIPQEAFPGVQFVSPLQDELNTGTAVLFSGHIADQSKANGQILFRFTEENGEVIRIFADLDGANFHRYHVFDRAQAGTYEMEIFCGGAGDESLAYIGGYSTVRIAAGSGAVVLPADFFSGVLLDAPFATEMGTGQGIALSGRITDASKADGQILFKFVSREGGEDIAVFIDLQGVDFNRGYTFLPGAEGAYDLKIYLGGPDDSSLPYLDGFAVRIVAGGGLVSIPLDYFRGIVLDTALPFEWPAGRDRWLSGSAGPDVVAVRVELEGEGIFVKQRIALVDGRFRLPLYLDAAASGDLLLRFYRQGEDGNWANGGEIQLKAVKPLPAGQLQVGALALGVRSGETTALTLINVGDARLGQIRYEVEGPFSLEGDESQLVAGEQIAVQVRYEGGGGDSGVLFVYSDDPLRPVQQVALSGLSTAANALPFLHRRAEADGTLALDLDLARNDYMLVVYSTAVAEVDEDAYFAYSVGGPLPAARWAMRGETANETIESQLRARERLLATSYRNSAGPSLKRTAVKIEVGDRRRFVYTRSGEDALPKNVDATAIYVGERAVAWVQDDLRPAGDNLSREEMAAVVEQFSRDDFAPIAAAFGRASDVDGDGRIAFLFTHWVDDEDGIAGFYNASSVLSVEAGGDGNMTDLMFISPTQSLDFYRSLLVHEFQHLINFNEHVLERRGEGEASWLNEGLSHLAEDLVSGYSESGNDDNIAAYLRDPEATGLIGDAGGYSARRGAAYLFVRGLRDRFGPGIVHRLVATGLADRSNVEEATGQTMDEVLAFWGTQLYASGQGIDPHPFFNFTSSLLQAGNGRGLPLPAQRRYVVGAQPIRGQLPARGIAYVRVRGGVETRLLLSADPAARMGVVAMPLRAGFVDRAQMPPDYVPGLHFDRPLPAVLLAEGQYRVSGQVVDETIRSLLLRFAGVDTLRFAVDIVDGEFDEVLSVPTVGEYAIEVFAGSGEGLLGYVAGFAPVWVEEASDITAVEAAIERGPTAYALGQAYPNPFNASIVVPFDILRSDESVSLEVFNALGQKVRTLRHGNMASGAHRAVWDGRDDAGRSLASGLYWFRLRAADFKAVHGAVLLR